MEKMARQAFRRLVALSGCVAVAGVLAGCSIQMERAPVDLHVEPTTEGVGWSYRAKAYETEGILAGEKSDYSIRGDAAKLASTWGEHYGRVTVQRDSASPFILIKLSDLGTRRKNPLHGGPFSWDLYTLQEMVMGSLPVIGSDEPRYSVHLVALADDQRSRLNHDEVAQVRLRRLASVLVEAGVDPRMVTGQVWEGRDATTWKLALALRPYRYGEELTSGALIAPESF